MTSKRRICVSANIGMVVPKKFNVSSKPRALTNNQRFARFETIVYAHERPNTIIIFILCLGSMFLIFSAIIKNAKIITASKISCILNGKEVIYSLASIRPIIPPSASTNKTPLIARTCCCFVNRKAIYEDGSAIRKKKIGMVF